MKRFKKDMKENGFDANKPVEAAETVDDGPVIIDGHHRTEAARQARIPKIPVKKVEVPPERASELADEAADAAAERAIREH